MENSDLKNRFSFHPADTPEKQHSHEMVRDELLDTAVLIDNLVPDSRELSLAITKLEEAMMWANAGIARHGAMGERPS